MNMLAHILKPLTSVEEFLDHFNIDYDPTVIRVSRLHIMQRFHQYLRQTPGLGEMGEVEVRAICRKHLTQAYQDFVESTPLKEKVFKVLRTAEGVSTVSLSSLRANL
jgi:nitrogenase-stabilizing/protective protein